MTEELETFAYSVAHDLKSPLRAMEGFSKALFEDYGKTLDQVAHGYLDRIAHGAVRMGNLIDDLLRYSRIGRDELKFEPVSIAEVFAQVKANLKTEIDDAGITIEVRGELPDLVGNRLTLELILQNLLSNAIKFISPSRKPEIILSATQDNGNCIILSLQDNGIGIEPNHQDRIFNIFQRLHVAESYTGTGIGLAIVKKGVSLHNGSISVDSQVGVGSTFSLRLPRKKSAATGPQFL